MCITIKVFDQISDNFFNVSTEAPSLSLSDKMYSHTVYCLFLTYIT